MPSAKWGMHKTRISLTLMRSIGAAYRDTPLGFKRVALAAKSQAYRRRGQLGLIGASMTPDVPAQLLLCSWQEAGYEKCHVAQEESGSWTGRRGRATSSSIVQMCAKTLPLSLSVSWLLLLLLPLLLLLLLPPPLLLLTLLPPCLLRTRIDQLPLLAVPAHNSVSYGTSMHR